MELSDHSGQIVEVDIQPKYSTLAQQLHISLTDKGFNVFLNIVKCNKSNKKY